MAMQRPICHPCVTKGNYLCDVQSNRPCTNCRILSNQRQNPVNCHSTSETIPAYFAKRNKQPPPDPFQQQQPQPAMAYMQPVFFGFAPGNHPLQQMYTFGGSPAMQGGMAQPQPQAQAQPVPAPGYGQGVSVNRNTMKARKARQRKGAAVNQTLKQKGDELEQKEDELKRKETELEQRMTEFERQTNARLREDRLNRQVEHAREGQDLQAQTQNQHNPQQPLVGGHVMPDADQHYQQIGGLTGTEDPDQTVRVRIAGSAPRVPTGTTRDIGIPVSNQRFHLPTASNQQLRMPTASNQQLRVPTAANQQLRVPAASNQELRGPIISAPPARVPAYNQGATVSTQDTEPGPPPGVSAEALLAQGDTLEQLEAWGFDLDARQRVRRRKQPPSSGPRDSTAPDDR